MMIGKLVYFNGENKGEIMKKLAMVLALTSVLGLTACNQEPQGAIVVPEQAEIAPEPIKIDHYYSMKDGYEYGYEQAISQDSADAGQVASTLAMFKYSGQKDGVYQTYTKNVSGVITSLQCNNPCDFIKVMTFLNGQHLTTERLKATEGSIGWTVMADAINGQLEAFVQEKNGKSFSVWFDEEKGLQTTAVDKW